MTRQLDRIQIADVTLLSRFGIAAVVEASIIAFEYGVLRDIVTCEMTWGRGLSHPTRGCPKMEPSGIIWYLFQQQHFVSEHAGK